MLASDLSGCHPVVRLVFSSVIHTGDLVRGPRAGRDLDDDVAQTRPAYRIDNVSSHMKWLIHTGAAHLEDPLSNARDLEGRQAHWARVFVDPQDKLAAVDCEGRQIDRQVVVAIWRGLELPLDVQVVAFLEESLVCGTLELGLIL